jgi:hypothetical protein
MVVAFTDGGKTVGGKPLTIHDRAYDDDRRSVELKRRAAQRKKRSSSDRDRDYDFD